MHVAAKVGNLPSKFEHARPLGSRIIRYVRHGRTDGRTNATLIPPSLATGTGHNNSTETARDYFVGGSRVFYCNRSPPSAALRLRIP